MRSSGLLPLMLVLLATAQARAGDPPVPTAPSWGQWSQTRINATVTGNPYGKSRDDAVRATAMQASADRSYGPTAKPISWWSVPWRARTAARQLASTQNASVTRYVKVEELDGSIRYDVYAGHRVGFVIRDEFVLVSVPDAQKKPGN